MHIYRNKNNAIVGGVFAAISERVGVNVWVIRLIMSIVILSAGIIPGILIYFIACAVMPWDTNKKQESIDSDVVYNKRRNNLPNNSLKIKEIVKRINFICNGILSRSYANKVASSMLDEFREKIIEFKNYSPMLENQYYECMKILAVNKPEEILYSIEENKKRMMMSSLDAQKNYQNIIEQKEMRLKYIEQIKEYKEIIESKLQLILDTVKNIEVSILQTELKTQVDDTNYNEVQQQISIFSESISEVSDIYKKTKIRL